MSREKLQKACKYIRKKCAERLHHKINFVYLQRNMKYVSLPGEELCGSEKTHAERGASFYLAAEEYVARRMCDADDCFMMWQVDKSVVCGRNQLIETEVNLDYCRAHDIKVYRRKSGGGCIYADLGNVMLSYITSQQQVNLAYNNYVNLIEFALLRMGIKARATGRNDILVDEKKVSGTAFYGVAGRSIIHGTLLYDTNLQHISAAITPPKQKLQSKGVASVRQHITLLKDHTDLSFRDIRRQMRQILCRDELPLTDADVVAIRELERSYQSPDFLWGKNPSCTATASQRFEGVGTVEAHIDLRQNVIRRVTLKGDFFALDDVDERLCQPLRGVKAEPEAIRKALPDNTQDIIRGLQKDDLVSLLSVRQ